MGVHPGGLWGYLDPGELGLTAECRSKAWLFLFTDLYTEELDLTSFFIF